VIRRLLWPALMTAAMLVVLLGLGTWQLRRLAWKEALLDQIDRAEAAPAVPLPALPPPFAKVAVTGRLRQDLAAVYGADVRDGAAGPVLGADLIVPLQRTDGPDVLVDLGWVPLKRDKPLDLPGGEVTVTGFVHPADAPGLFSAHDDPVTRQFYTLDPVAIGAALGLPAVAPYTLVAMGPAPASGMPDPARHLPRPPNDHLQYAITWFGLAFALVVIFGIWARKVITA
jgi:surfeit locus 1 family protein